MPKMMQVLQTTDGRFALAVPVRRQRGKRNVKGFAFWGTTPSGEPRLRFGHKGEVREKGKTYARKSDLLKWAEKNDIGVVTE